MRAYAVTARTKDGRSGNFNVESIEVGASNLHSASEKARRKFPKASELLVFSTTHGAKDDQPATTNPFILKAQKEAAS